MKKYIVLPCKTASVPGRLFLCRGSRAVPCRLDENRPPFRRPVRTLAWSPNAYATLRCLRRMGLREIGLLRRRFCRGLTVSWHSGCAMARPECVGCQVFGGRAMARSYFFCLVTALPGGSGILCEGGRSRPAPGAVRPLWARGRSWRLWLRV